MAEVQEEVRLAGSVLSRSCHVCAFFHSKEEEYQVLMPFIKEGIERGDHAFHVVDAKTSNSPPAAARAGRHRCRRRAEHGAA